MELKRYLRVVGRTGDDDDDYSMVEISNRRAKEAADLIEKLEEQAHYANGVADLAMKHRDYAEQRVAKLEVALKNISEGDIPRKVKIPFRDDGQSSKHDRCEHGQWFYEDCGCCIEDYARKALEGETP
jgi:hypothetical protein